MFYTTDFVIPSSNIVPPVKRNAFTVILRDSKKKKILSPYSIAYAYKPFLYFASIVSMHAFVYSKRSIKVNGIFSKIHCLFTIIMHTAATVLIRQRSWGRTAADVPLTLLAKTFTIFQNIELSYNIFTLSFEKSAFYINLITTIDDIDGHFNTDEKQLFSKRRRFVSFLLFVTINLVLSTLLFNRFRLSSLLTYTTFLFVLLQGVNCVFFFLTIYIQLLNFNSILSNKASKLSESKKLIMKNGITANLLQKMLSNSVNTFSNNSYCWFELMQIYDKISDCIYIFNKIYAQQILLMFNSWFLSTLLVICRSISPVLKEYDIVKTDVYYYIFLNLRPILVTKLCENFIQERRKTLIILQHVLIDQNLDHVYRKQVETMIQLVESRNMKISASVCSINLRLMIAFAGRVISYSVLMIQNFYSRH